MAIEGDIVRREDFKDDNGDKWTAYYFVVGRTECHVCVPFLFHPITASYYKAIQDVLNAYRFYVECLTKKPN